MAPDLAAPVAGDGCPPSPVVAVQRLAARLDEAFRAAAALVPPGTAVRIDRHRLSLLASCPASLADSGGAAFEWSAPIATRAVGVRALGRILTGGVRIQQAVLDTVDELASEGDGAAGLGAWLALQPPGVRGVLVARASTWAHGLLAGASTEGATGVRVDQAATWPGRAADHGVHLRARYDLVAHHGRTAVVHVHTPVPGEVELVAAGWVLGHPHGRTRRLAAVVAVDPPTGAAVRHPVDAGLLERAGEVLAGAARAVAAAAAGLPLDERPGPRCRWCARQPDCASGSGGRPHGPDGARQAAVQP